MLVSFVGCKTPGSPAAGENSQERLVGVTPEPETLVSQVSFQMDEELEPQWARVAQNLSNQLSGTLESPGLGLAPDPVSMEEASSVTLAELETMSIGAHPAITELNARVEVARGKAIQAGLPFNPTLLYQSDEIGNDDTTGLHSVGLSQQFVTANKLSIAQQVQLQHVQKLLAELQRTELQVRTAVRIAFVRALVAQQRTQLTSQLVMLSQESVKSVEDLFNAEEVSKVALLQARVEAQQAQIAADNAVTLWEASRRTLAAAVGVPDLSANHLIGDLTEDLTEEPWDELLARITTVSPELSTANAEIERARHSLQLACAQVTPNVTGQVGIGIDTATDDTFASIGVSVPLPIRNRNEGNIRAARAGITAASASLERTRLDLSGRLAGAVARYHTARQRFQRLNTQVLPIAEETLSLSRQAFEAGEAAFLELLTAQRTLFTTRLSSLEAVGLAREALAEIEGMLVSTTSGSNSR